jgi:hypothetical protein
LVGAFVVISVGTFPRTIATADDDVISFSSCAIRRKGWDGDDCEAEQDEEDDPWSTIDSMEEQER